MNIEKKCIFCEEIIDNKKHGLTKYCSPTCRNKDYYQKNLNNYSKNHSSNSQTEKSLNEFDSLMPNSTNENTFQQDNKEHKFYINNYRESDIPVQRNGSNSNTYIYSLIEDKFEAKNESVFYKIKCEQLEAENTKLKNEIFELQSELEESDKEENENSLGFLSGLPENVIAGITKAAIENEKVKNFIQSIFSNSSASGKVQPT